MQVIGSCACARRRSEQWHLSHRGPLLFAEARNSSECTCRRCIACRRERASSARHSRWVFFYQATPFVLRKTAARQLGTAEPTQIIVQRGRNRPRPTGLRARRAGVREREDRGARFHAKLTTSLVNEEQHVGNESYRRRGYKVSACHLCSKSSISPPSQSAQPGWP